MSNNYPTTFEKQTVKTTWKYLGKLLEIVREIFENNLKIWLARASGEIYKMD